MTKIDKCDCLHDYQDAVYGRGMRVHNVKSATNKSEERVSCTVCGKGARTPSPHKQGFRSPRVGKTIVTYPVK